jgi:GntR family transcriptional regulator, transcriptional repressor for pyruvate dehydrogenase complex
VSEKQKKLRIADEVFEDLRSAILSGRYSAGERLPPERDLSTQLGTNRNTLREAIRRLEEMRLVTVRQGQGVTVSDFRRTATIHVLDAFLAWGSNAGEKAHALNDLLGARTTVLEYALELAVERADTSDLARLADIRHLLVTAWKSQDRDSLRVGFEHWLSALVDAAHSLPARWIANPFLEMNRSFMERFPALWVLDEEFPRYLDATERAIRLGDLDAAKKANRMYYGRIDAKVSGMLRQVFDAMSDLGGAPTGSNHRG